MSHRIRILQASDFHLCARPPGAAGLPEEVRERIRLALLESFRRFCALGEEKDVDALLVPGDLFDGESVEDRLLAETLAILRGVSRPVLVAPGNHDYYSPAGFWSPRYLKARGLTLPPHLHVVTGEGFQTFDLPGAGRRATVTAACYRDHEGAGVGLDASPPGDDRIHLLMLHGSLLGHEWPGKTFPMPFSREDLTGLGFDYAALGHYHSHIVIRDDRARVRGAYSGIPQPRRHREAGETGALLVDVGKERGDSRTRVERFGLAGHAFHRLRVDVTGAGTPGEAAGRVRAALASCGASEDDLVRVLLEGVVAPHLTPGDMAEAVDRRGFLHLEVRAGGVLPDYTFTAADGPGSDLTVEDAFRKRMKARLEEAEERGDEEEAARVRRAFAYGMDALLREEVTARHVD